MKEFEPHRVFKSLPYPKTGGRLGKCYLLWGNELKHHFFPLIGMVGPDYPRLFVMLCLPVIILICFLGCMRAFETEKTWAKVIAYTVFVMNEICILTCALSNPGIVFRGSQDPNRPSRLQCSCFFIRSL